MVTLTENVEMDVELDNLVSLDLAEHTINGNVSIDSEYAGTIEITAGTITGDLTINTPNATITNSATVNGETNIISVDSSSFISTGTHAGGIQMKGKGRLILSGSASAAKVTVNTAENVTEEVILEGDIENIILVNTNSITVKATNPTITVERDAEVKGLRIDTPATII